MKQINYFCPYCRQVIHDLHRHNSKDKNGYTRCERKQKHLFEKKG